MADAKRELKPSAGLEAAWKALSERMLADPDFAEAVAELAGYELNLAGAWGEG